jgi:hypothetical protein
MTSRILFLLLFCPFFIRAQPTALKGFELLYSIDSLTVVIETDVRKLQRDRNPDLWLPGEIELRKGTKTVLKQAVEVQARGNARRKICAFPPVKIRFADALGMPDSLKGAEVVKIVSACNDEEQSEHLVLKEYLMYQLYQTLTEESFRTKLAVIQFREKGRRQIYASSYGFFLENEATLAKRLNGNMYRPSVMSPKGIDSLTMDRVCLFEFMIGNTDWSVYNLHNIRALLQNATRKVVAIPYDFDYAGAVDAPYAVPQKGLYIKTVQDRHYFGLCRDKVFAEKTFNVFLQKKAALLATVDNFEPLSTFERKKVRSYLNSFFDVLANPKQTRVQILEHCDNFKK